MKFFPEDKMDDVETAISNLEDAAADLKKYAEFGAIRDDIAQVIAALTDRLDELRAANQSAYDDMIHDQMRDYVRGLF